MKKILLLQICVAILISLIACKDDEPALTCDKPAALLFTSDSIVYRYSSGRIVLVEYFISGRKTNKDEFLYNSGGQLAAITKAKILIDGSESVESYHTLAYGSDGLPSELETDSFSGHYSTEFVHDDNKRLVSAETSYGFQRSFVGKTRYEYDANGNIPKVFYTIDLNHDITEVLARENLSFDDKEKYYKNSAELKIANEYVYGYLPNSNNCMSSKVYYYSYDQHFTSPMEVTFSVAYDEDGRIKTLESDETTQLFTGEVLFNKAVYTCI